MMENIIAIYPGRYQPFSPHHFKVLQWIWNEFGKKNTYITTSDNIKSSNSFFNFIEKQSIIYQYDNNINILNLKSPYIANDFLEKKYQNNTIVVYIVGEKDMKENPRFNIGYKKDMSQTYFQDYKSNINNLQPWQKHGYLLIAPNITVNTKIKNFNFDSATKLREYLSNITKKSEFIDLFGWYDEKIANMMIQKITNDTNYSINTNEQIFTQNWWSDILQNHISINEGGSAGHMDHIFNVDMVNTGSQLLDIFNKSIESLQQAPASVKIDGVNASIRLTTLDGKKQFVLDRGSMKPLDVKGITKNDLLDRFGDGHGMISIGHIVLDIFNDALSIITPELKKLGMYDNPDILFNIEYVSGGKTNVVQYNNIHNFLAIHGLLELYQVTPKKRATKEISYNKSTLQQLLNKLNPVANKYKYNIVGSIPTIFKYIPSLNTELKKQIPIIYNNDTIVTKTLQQWLHQTEIPHNIKIKIYDNGVIKTVDALSKSILINILNKNHIQDFVVNESDYKFAIDGFITYFATMQFGDVILSSLSSDIGDVESHEGIVIRDKNINNGTPYKITGSFIIKGMTSAFRN